MLAQQLHPNATTATHTTPIRRIHSAPRLISRRRPYRQSPDTSALIASPLATPDSSSGDEAVSLKQPKIKAQFECNICFDAARDPVVTQCGHLYCWPCLHRVLPLFM